MTDDEKTKIEAELEQLVTTGLDAMDAQSKNYGLIVYGAYHTDSFSAGYVGQRGRALDVALLCLNLIKSHPEVYMAALTLGDDVLEQVRAETDDIPAAH